MDLSSQRLQINLRSATARRWLRVLLISGLMLSVVPVRQTFSNAPTTAQKSIEDYWTETDLTTEDFEVLLKPTNCSQSQRHFLACINSVSAIAEKLGFVMLADGSLRRVNAEDQDIRLTEREDLKKWAARHQTTEQFKQIDFLKIWNELRVTLTHPTSLIPYLAMGINGYLSVAEDPHSYILPLAYYEEVTSRSESRSFQLGFVARRVRGGAIVRKVFSNSPAARAGLVKGDRILRLNGLDVARLHTSVYTDLIRGLVGERLLLEIERTVNDKKKTRYVEVRREQFQLLSVESRLLPGNNVGLLTIHKFAHDTCSQARIQLINMVEQSVKGLLIDLRDNPGGQVDEAACVLNLFLPKDTLLFETRYLDSARVGELYIGDRNQLYDGPLAVLINSGSASASEIVAGALKDHGRAILVGERSFGKGSFQDGGLWRPQSRIAFFQTQGFYYFPSGWTPQLVGLQPDIPVTVAGFESFREEDLYHLPLRPKDLWNGPQTLAWLHQARCAQLSPLGDFDDPQIAKAQQWVQCGEASRDARNGLNHDRN